MASNTFEMYEMLSACCVTVVYIGGQLFIWLSCLVFEAEIDMIIII